MFGTWSSWILCCNSWQFQRILCMSHWHLKTPLHFMGIGWTPFSDRPDGLLGWGVLFLLPQVFKWTEEGTRRCDATQYCALNGAEVTSITTSRTLRAVCKDYSLGFPTWLCFKVFSCEHLEAIQVECIQVVSWSCMRDCQRITTFERDLPTSGGLSGFCNDSIQL